MASLPIPNKLKRKLSAPVLRSSRKGVKVGFTLVELIVVITILAILGTVGFLSLGGYSSNARDSQRSTDVANLSKSLDVSVITVGSYPSPDNAFSVTYSGGTVWYQGTFSTGALSKLGGNGLNKRPLDPLKSTEYAYSTLAFGKAYSIKADYEWSVAFNPFVQTAHAAPGNPTVAFVRGNYGWLTAKTETGSVTYVIALPSILTNTGSAGATLEIKSNALSGTLLFDGKNLTNASSFNPTTVVFSGASLPKDDKAGQVTAMMTALKNAYASSDVASSVPAVQTLVNTATWSLATLGTSVIVSQLGGSATSAPTVNNLVSWACTSLPAGAAYYNGSSTGYTLSDAPTGASLSAIISGYNVSPTANTCQYSCKNGYSYNSGNCTLGIFNATSGLTYAMNDKGDISCNGRYYISTNKAGVTSLYATYCPSSFTGPSSNAWIQSAFNALSTSEKNNLMWSAYWAVNSSCWDIGTSYPYAIKTNNIDEFAYWPTTLTNWSYNSTGTFYVQVMCTK